MFTNNELIRIYYAIKADQKQREASPHADMFASEIQFNKDVMAKIVERGLIAETKEAPVRKPDLTKIELKQHLTEALADPNPDYQEIARLNAELVHLELSDK